MFIIENLLIRALNDAESSENRIHSDEIAAKYGFSGALVSGANLFGYLTQPLAEPLGGSLLCGTSFDVRFLKPAYHDEQLLITTEETGHDADGRHFDSSAFNERGVLLAELKTTHRNHMPQAGRLHAAAPIAMPQARAEISWERIKLSEPAADISWTPGEADNRQRVEAQRDRSELYRGPEANVHPYYLLDACNKALMSMFILPAWIHTGSQLSLRRPMRVGQDITIRAVPVEKWERKGHQFIRLSISMIAEQEIAAEILHTAIFRIAGT